MGSALDRFYEEKKKKESANITTAKSGGSALDRFKAEKERKEMPNKIDSYFKDAQAYFKWTTEDYNSYSYDNAAAGRSKIDYYTNDLRTRGNEIRTWLDANKDTLDAKSYADIIASLDSVSSGLDSIYGEYDKKLNYISGFNSAEEYNKLPYNPQAQKAAQEYLQNSLSQPLKTNTKTESNENRNFPAINFSPEVALGAMEDDLGKLQGMLKEDNDIIYEAERMPRDKKLAMAQGYTEEEYNRIIGSLDYLAKRYGVDTNDLNWHEKLTKDVASKEYQLHVAKTQYEGSILANNALSANDYGKYVNLGKEIGNKIAELRNGDNWKKYESGAKVTDIATDVYLGGVSGGSAGATAGGLAGRVVDGFAERRLKNNIEYLAAKHMTDTEFNIYNYYYAKDKANGTNYAKQYLNSLEETLTDREAGVLYDENTRNGFLKFTFGINAGLDQFESGVANLFSNDYDPSAIQKASGMIREDYGKVGRTFYDLASTSANMLPSVLTSTVVGIVNPVAGSYVGAGLLGASAAGNAKNEMLGLGYSLEQANAYGAMVGVSEALLEKFLGGIGKLTGGSGGIFTTIANKFAPALDRALGRVAISGAAKFIAGMADEALEEMIQEVLDPVFKGIATGEEVDSAKLEDVLYAGLLGALTGGLFEGVPAGANVIGNKVAQNAAIKEHGQAILDTSGQEGVDSLKQLALDIYSNKGGADAYKGVRLIGNMTDKASAKNVGKLSAHIENTIAKQNHADIAAALEAKGLSKKDARTATQYIKGELDTNQIAKVKENKTIMDAIEAVKSDESVDLGANNAKLLAARLGIKKDLQSDTNSDIINESEEISNEGTDSVRLRDGSERTDGENTEGSVFDLESDTGAYQGRRKSGRVADSEAARLANEGREVSVASLGILRGSANHTVRLVDAANETPTMKKARERAEARGLKVKFFAGDNLVIADKEGKLFSARGYILGDTVLVRADHDLYTAEQLMRHEIGHDMIAKGEVDVNEARERLEKVIGKENVDALADAYAYAYAGTTLTAAEIWEECVCDSLGDINIFVSNKELFNAMTDMLEGVKKATLSTVKEPNQTRGSPEGKASQEIGGQNENNRNTELLERGKVQTSNRSENDIWKHSKNTRTLQGLLGLSNKELQERNIRAGASEWLENYTGELGFGTFDEKQRVRRFLQSVCRKLSKTQLKSTDTVGRKLPNNILKNFANTAFKREDGTILSLWHWTKENFTKFQYGDIGFHAGTFDASHAIMFAKSEQGEKGVFKELYFNSENPLYIDRDLGTSWTPHLVAVCANVLSNSEISSLSSLDGYTRQQYDSAASIRLREMLKEKGYDSIVYTNDWEGGLSVIAFDNEQFYTVAENGIETNGKASRELDVIDYMNEQAEREGRELAKPRSNREILANALESSAQHEVEKKRLAEYKAKIKDLDAEQEKLKNLKAEIKELTFGKEKKDPAKLKALREEAVKTENRIKYYDKKLLELEAMTAIKNVLEVEKLRSFKSAMSKAREIMHEGVQGRYKTVERNKIKRVAHELDALLNRGTKERNVKKGVSSVVRSALDISNMLFATDDELLLAGIGTEYTDTEKAAMDKYMALYEEYHSYDDAVTENKEKRKELRSEMNEVKKEFWDVLERERKRIASLKAKGAFDALIEEYGKLANSDEGYIRQVFDTDTLEHIKKLREDVGETLIKDMTLDQLQKVYKAYRMVQKMVTDANKAFASDIKESIVQMGEAAQSEVESHGEKGKETIKMLKGFKALGWNNLKPIYLMERTGSKTLQKLFQNILDAESQWAKYAREAQQYIAEQKKKYGYKKWNFDKSKSFTDPAGREYKLTLDQMMTVYAYSKRGEQAIEHLRNDGFVFDKITIKKKGIEYELTDKTAYKISDSILLEIINGLTEDQKAYVDAMQKYLSDTLGKRGNEVSNKLYGIDLFNEENYLPIRSERAYLERARDKDKGVSKIKNRGFTKPTQKNARNAIVLEDFNKLCAEHIVEMNEYAAFTLPLEDFYRVYNYQNIADDNTGKKGVIPALMNAYGEESTKAIDRLLEDLNGSARTEYLEGFAKTTVGLFKKAKVMLSLSVIVQQPTSIIRAQALINPKYFAGKKLDKARHKAAWEELKKYAPVAIIKEMGYFDIGMGRSTVDWLLGDKTIMDRVDEVTSRGAARADENAWVDIWNAVKRETLHNNPTMSPKSEEFLNIAGKRFEDIIRHTQVYDSTLSRSANMRHKSLFMKMSTAFMAEPTTAINMREMALRSKDKARIARVTYAIYTTAIVNALRVALIYAMRDDDEDETFIEKYTSALISSFVDNVNPMNAIPFFKDIWSAAMGYSIERTDMSLFEDIFASTQKLVQLYATDNRDKNQIGKAWVNLIGDLANLTGIPAKNLYREINGAVNMVKTVKRDIYERDTSWGSLGDEAFETIKGEVPVWGWLPNDSKTDKLYDAIMKGDKAYEDRIKSGYDTDAKYQSAVRKALKENDPRIAVAAQALIDGDYKEYSDIIEDIVAEGHFSEKDVKAVIQSMAKDLEGETEEEESTAEEKDESIFETEYYYNAIVSGDTSYAEEMREDIINSHIANGMDEEEANKKFESSFRSYVGKMYVGDKTSYAEAMRMLVEYTEDEENDAYWDLRKWDYQKANGTTDGYYKYGDFYEAVKTGKDLKAVIKEYTSHGVEKKSLASQITSYYKPIYKEMTNRERANLKGYLLNAYVLLGYDRSKKMKDIDKWLEE